MLIFDNLEMWGKGNLKMALYHLGDNKYQEHASYFVRNGTAKKNSEN